MEENAVVAELSRLGFPHLLSQALDGDQDAWSRIVQAVRPHLKRKLEFLGVRNTMTDGSDVVQDALLAAFRHLEQFMGENVESFLGWLWTIAAREARNAYRYDHQKKRDIRRLRPLPEGPSGSDRLLDPEARLPGGALEREEAVTRLLDSIDQLTEKQAEVLRLRFFENLSFSAIAELTDSQVDAVRQLAQRALGQLRKDPHLARYLDGDL